MKTHRQSLVVSLLSTLILMAVLCFQSGVASAQDKDNKAKSIIPVISSLLLSDRPLEIVTGSTLSNAYLAQFYSQGITAVGGTRPYAWSVTGTFLLPQGLSLNTGTGVISGTPQKTGSFSFQIKVTDSENTAVVRSFTIAITSRTTSGSPAPPSELTTFSLSTSSIGLDWKDNSSNEEYFEIERSPDVINFSYYDRWSGVPSVDDVDLTQDTHYCYRIRAYNSSGYSDYTNISCKWTKANLKPRPPTNLTALAVSESTILLTWTNNSQSDQYRVFESVNGGAYVDAGTVPEDNVPGAYINGLTAGKSYRYYIQAHNSLGYSVNSTSSNSVTTPGATASSVKISNNTSYPIISLKIDGVEKFPNAPMGIPPGGTHQVQVTTGSHSYRAVNGFWNGGSRFEMYIFQNTWNQPAGIYTATINNPSIGQLLTRWSPSRLYLGETWTGTTFNYQGFRFYGNGTYNFYKNNVLVGSGNYALVSYPGSYTVTFSVSGNQNATGYYDELGGNFSMRNGPPDWPAVNYLESGN